MTRPADAISRLVEDASRTGENFDCEHLYNAGWVYVLASGNRLKIGSVRVSETFAKRGPIKALTNRLREVQAMSPADLTLLRLYTGGPPYERELHRKFNEQRAHGEWFSVAVLADLHFTGCPACETVIVPSDLADMLLADLAKLRGPP